MPQQHLCSNCFEVDKGYIVSEDAYKLCNQCGGVVLTVQEAADMIGDLKSQLRNNDDAISEDYLDL
jgi:hypothetical protein